MINVYDEKVTTLRQETANSKGTEIIHPLHGLCRIKHVYPHKKMFSYIIGDKPIGSNSDAWGLIDDQKIMDWSKNLLDFKH